MTDEQYATDLKVMIEADRGHLAQALDRGDTVAARGFRDAILGNEQELETVEARLAAARK